MLILAETFILVDEVSNKKCFPLPAEMPHPVKYAMDTLSMDVSQLLHVCELEVL